MTAPTTSPAAEAAGILAAAGIETADDATCRAAVRGYQDAPVSAPQIPLRLGTSHASVMVDGWQAKKAAPVLYRLQVAADALTAAGWSVVRVTADRFRADPPTEAERLAALQVAEARRFAVARLAELRAELHDLADALGPETTDGHAAARAFHALTPVTS